MPIMTFACETRMKNYGENSADGGNRRIDDIKEDCGASRFDSIRNEDIREQNVWTKGRMHEWGSQVIVNCSSRDYHRRGRRDPGRLHKRWKDNLIETDSEYINKKKLYFINE